MTGAGWPPVDEAGLFGLDNLPYGSASRSGGDWFVAVRIGNHALDLGAAFRHLSPGDADLFSDGRLDRLLATGPRTWDRVRANASTWLSDGQFRPVLQPLLHPLDSLRTRLAFTVGDYVDFYAAEQHATNVGQMFRPGQAALPPNWKHLPIGYHGRAGTIVVSGTGITRPRGQYRGVDGQLAFGPSTCLDIEAEVAFVVGRGTALGQSVPVADFPQYVFGVALLNDWSARDVQRWEAAPLGPLLGKSFATSLSAWITPLPALAAARRRPPVRDEPMLPYLQDAEDPWGLDLQLEVRLNGALVSRPPFLGMYWSAAQMLAHMTVNGASLRPGDVFASGTVSGPGRDQWGSLLELTWDGTEPLRLDDGSQRGFLQDGDEVVIRATAPTRDGRLALGEVSGRVRPAG
ncbi:MAG: fumarylacetoacetase [Actinobacteria bacterium]|nr:fumarylacetoacetase [Actinomycetota bacterium]